MTYGFNETLELRALFFVGEPFLRQSVVSFFLELVELPHEIYLSTKAIVFVVCGDLHRLPQFR